MGGWGVGERKGGGRMRWRERRWMVGGGGGGGGVVGMGVGLVGNGVADGWMAGSESRMDLGDAAMAMLWGGVVEAQRAGARVREMSVASCDAGYEGWKRCMCMSWRLAHKRTAQNRNDGDFRKLARTTNAVACVKA